VYNVGFGTFRGAVTAAPRWGVPGSAVELSEALPQSYCGIIHRASVERARVERDAAKSHSDTPTDGQQRHQRQHQKVGADDGRVHGGGIQTKAAHSERPSRPDESVVGADLLFRFNSNEAARKALEGPCLERMVGVVYDRPREAERHYVECSLPQQFCAWIHIDETTAVVPLREYAEAAH
jgi:erythromycin esterase-like protein